MASDEMNGYAPDGDEHDHDLESHALHHRDAGVIVVGRRNYAWGLTWELPHVDKGGRRAIARIALTSAREHSFDLFCPFNSHMYALGSTEAGQKRGMLSLAASIMSADSDLSKNCLLAISVGDDSVYLLAIDENGLINPTTDTLLKDVAARQIFTDLRDSNSWRVVRCPARWEEDFAEVGLSEILPPPSSACRLKSAVTNDTLVFLFKCMLVVGSICAAWYCWSWYSDYRIEENARLARMETARNDAAARQAAIDAALREAWPYDRAIRGAVAISRCQAVMGITPTILPDYQMTSMQCVPASGIVRVNFAATSPLATHVHVGEYVDAMTKMKPHLVDAKNAEILVYDYKKAFLPDEKSSYPVHDGYMPVSDEEKYLTDAFDAIHLLPNVTFQEVDPPHSPPRHVIPGQVLSPKVDSKVFRILHVGIQTSYTPDNFIPILAPLKAWTVTLVEYAAKDRTWRINADVYEGVMQSVIDKSRPSLNVGAPTAVNTAPRR